MESLYRAYRPLTFEQVVGQAHVVDTLEHAIQEGRTSHAYLFTGPRGTGKTTMARILAKAMVCEAGAGVLPDGTCPQCTAIAEGTHPDVYELDAASRTGVDAVREEIVNRVDYAPVQGRSKVYIIDEVHMLTTQAFNALLKTLEEPPSHVVFVLCTTDPQKIPSTILSRVQRFDFRAISNEDIEKHLLSIAQKEGFNADAEAIALITRRAQGGMRDAISLLEQLSVFGKGDLSLANAQALLGEATNNDLGLITAALAVRDTAALFTELARLLSEGQDIHQFMRDLTAHLRDLYVVAITKDESIVLDKGSQDIAEMKREGEQLGGPEKLEDLLELFADTLHNMRFSTYPRLDVEVAFARATKAASPNSTQKAPVPSEQHKVTKLSQAAAAPKTPAATPTAAAAARQPTPSAVPAASALATPAAKTTVVPPSTPAAPAVPAAKMPVSAPPIPEAPAASAPVPAPSAPTTPAAPPTTTSVPVAQAWPHVLRAVQKERPSLYSLLQASSVKDENEKVVTIAVQNFSPFAQQKLNSASDKQFLEKALREAGSPKTLTFVAGSTSPVITPEPLVQKAPTASPETLIEEVVDDSPSESPNESSPDPIPQDPAPATPMKDPGETGTFAPSDVEAAVYNQHQQSEKKAQEADAATATLSKEEQDVISMIADSFGSDPTVLSVED